MLLFWKMAFGLQEKYMGERSKFKSVIFIQVSICFHAACSNTSLVKLASDLNGGAGLPVLFGLLCSKLGQPSTCFMFWHIFLGICFGSARELYIYWSGAFSYNCPCMRYIYMHAWGVIWGLWTMRICGVLQGRQLRVVGFTNAMK